MEPQQSALQVIPPEASQSLSVYEKFTNPLDAIKQLGQWITDSGMLGRDAKPSHGMLLAWTAVTEKKNPLILIQENHIIEGKLSKKADMMLAEFLALGKPRKVKWIKWDKDEASAKFVDGEGNEYEMSYTYKEACESGFPFTWKNDEKVLKKNWRESPANMLRARLVSNTLRMIEPKVVKAIYTPEEIADMDPDTDAPAAKPLFTPPVGSAIPAATEPKAPTFAESIVVDSNQGTPAAAQTIVIVPPPLEKTIAEMRKVVEERFSKVSTDFDAFCLAKGWIKSGEGLPAVSDDNIRRVYKNLDESERIFTAWKRAKDNLKGAKK